jgi:hypothetical protein
MVMRHASPCATCIAMHVRIVRCTASGRARLAEPQVTRPTAMAVTGTQQRHHQRARHAAGGPKAAPGEGASPRITSAPVSKGDQVFLQRHARGQAEEAQGAAPPAQAVGQLEVLQQGGGAAAQDQWAGVCQGRRGAAQISVMAGGSGLVDLPSLMPADQPCWRSLLLMRQGYQMDAK